MTPLFIAAVDFELDAARRAWGAAARYRATGVGPDATRRAMAALLSGDGPFDAVVEIGIAGSYGSSLPIGSVVHVTAEQFGERPGALLRQPSAWPELGFLPACTGNTVPLLEERFRQVEADVESMEGAAFFEACLERGVPFAEIRAVSNVVGELDHARWDIPLALRRLEDALESFKNVLK